MSKKIPMQPWFPDTHIADTALLNLEEQGAYRLLLDHMWISGGVLEDNDKSIARRLRVSTQKWQKLKQKLATYLMFCEGNITQKRLLDDYENVMKNIKTKIENGGKGGRQTAENWKRLKAGAAAEDDLFAAVKNRSGGSSRSIGEVLGKL